MSKSNSFNHHPPTPNRPDLFPYVEGFTSDNELSQVGVTPHAPREVLDKVSEYLSQLPTDRWQDKGLCTRADPELFTPGPTSAAAAGPAKVICRACCVVPECLEEAFVRDDRFSVMGGLSYDERRGYLRRRRVTRESYLAKLKRSKE